MYSPDTCAVKDMLATGCARGGNEERHAIFHFQFSIFNFPDGRKQNHLSNFQRGLIMFLLIAERACHTTAAAGNDIHLGI